MSHKTIWTGTIVLGSIIIACMTATAVENLPAKGDPSPAVKSVVSPDTECVVKLYRLMLQDAEPTAADDLEVFNDTETWIKSLKDRNELPEKNPTLLGWFRAHKDLFLPVNMKDPEELNFTSDFRYTANIHGPRRHFNPNFSWVFCTFIKDRSKPLGTQSMASVLFPLSHGKISPDGIQLNGFESPILLETWRGGK